MFKKRNPLINAILEDQYNPSMYEVHNELSVKPQFRTYAHTGLPLYSEIYKQIRSYIHPYCNIFDLGAYPGSFLRLLRHLEPNLHLYAIGLVCENDEIKRYSQRVRENNYLNIRITDKSFTEILKFETIEFINYNLDYCNSHISNIDQQHKDGSIDKYQGKADIVVSMETIEHLHTPYQLMDLYSNLTKKGGIMVLQTNNIRWIGNIYRLFVKGSILDLEMVEKYVLNDRSIKHPHIRFYSLLELKKLLEKAGFKVLQAYDFNWLYPYEFILSKQKYKYLLKTILSILPGFKSHIIVTGMKM